MALYRNSQKRIGPRMPQGSQLTGIGSGATVVIELDLKPLAEILSKFSKQVQSVALMRALNRAAGPFLTKQRRVLVEQTGAKYGRVMNAVRDKKASPGRLEYRIEAKDTPMTLGDFGVSGAPGSKNPSAAPWNHRQKFKGGFVVSGPHGNEIYKRVGKAHRDIKMLYGPIIPKELIRAGSGSLHSIEERRADVFYRRVPHELNFAWQQAGGNSSGPFPTEGL